MPDPSPVFILAIATFALAIVLGGAQLYRVRGKKPDKLKERAEQTTADGTPSPGKQHS